jgi:hypothetical protein
MMTARRLYDNGKVDLHSNMIEQCGNMSPGPILIEQRDKTGFNLRIIDQDELKALRL